MWMKEEENEQRQQWGGHIASELEALRTYLFRIYLLILGLIKWCYSLCLHPDRKFLNKVGNIIESQKVQNLQETICVKYIQYIPMYIGKNKERMYKEWISTLLTFDSVTCVG